LVREFLGSSVEAFRAVLKKCRTDWDITEPELKGAWQQRRKELFYPYGKT
jgi:hypothetical protein